MPICPGCERKIPYDKLDFHQRYCDHIRNDVTTGTVALKEIDRRLTKLEARLDSLHDVEADLERHLSKVERARRDVEPPSRK